MKRPLMVELSVFVVLIFAGVLIRLAFEHLPNFAPVAALAMFSGYYFRRWTVALCVPFAVMTISDWFIGGYHAVMMVTVYAMLAAPVCLRGILRSRLRLVPTHWRSTLTTVAGLLACSLASSLMFFAVTNVGSWWFSGIYEPTWGGLVRCYVQALPFFRYTLVGDMAFAVVLFGGYAFVLRLAYHLRLGTGLVVSHTE